MDKSTDVTSLAVLMMFICYENMNSFEESFYSVDHFYQTWQMSKFSDYWIVFLPKIIFHGPFALMCEVVVKPMVGAIAEVIAKIKEKLKEIRNSHCKFHRLAQAMKIMPSSLTT